MNKYIIHVIVFLLAMCTTLYAQQNDVYTIGGTVSDKVGVMPGVTITIKGKIGGTTTDNNGKFSIKVERGDWLVFSFVGFKTYEWLVTEEKKNLTVRLIEETQQVDEVVITGVGQQRKISNVAAITSVDVKELQVPAPSVVNMLGGKVAGIITTQLSGEPGKNLAEFWVRGIGTFGANSSALVLIDGLEGNINSVDPADIESFSVLKDASATAVYGVRGANGVVLITTKRGQSGQLSINGRYNTSISQIKRLPRYLRAYDYAKLVNEALEVRNENPIYNDIKLNVIKDGLDPDFYPDIDWQDEIVKPLSFKQSYYVSGRGGSEIARYFVSLGTSMESAAYKFEKNNPYASNAGYNTYSFRLNLDINLTKTTELKFSTDIFRSINNRPGSIGSTGFIWQAQARVTPLLFPIRYSNGQFPAATGAQTGWSPYLMINHTGNSKIQADQAKYALGINQDLDFVTEGLKLKLLGAYDRNGGFTESRYTFPALYRLLGRSNLGELITRQQVPASTEAFYSLGGNVQYRRFQLESTLNYDRVFSTDHRVGALAYFQMSDDQATNQMDNSDSEGLNASLAMIPKRYMRLAGRIAYGFRDTYMIDFNFGYTGSENFQPGRQFGIFPSIALGWVPTNYQWVKDNLSWVNFFKIRGSYGTVGNDRIGGSRFPYLNRVTRGSGSPWGSTSVETINISRVGADNLVWERAIKTNLGIDARMFNEALTFTIDFFKDRRKGIFQQRVQVPDYVGLISLPYGNVGSMMSWGSDGNISYKFNINKDMNVVIRGNYTYAQNKILNYERVYDPYPYQDFTGLPNSVVRGYQCLGFFKDQADIDYSPKQTWTTVMPGDLKYKDMNGDGKINVDDKVPISYFPMFPLVTYGIGGQFTYKDLSVGILFKGTGKMDYFRNNTGYIPFNEGELGNVLTMFNDPSKRWIPRSYIEAHGMDPSLAENPNAVLPRLQYGNNSNNTQLSDFWKGDARYLRLQEITINYNLKNATLKKIGITSIDLQLVGNNLYVWDKVKVFDPEQASAAGATYPIPAVYSFQLYINL